MSNRTAEANKAVRAAWEKEKNLVLSGKGTRDWTPEQQQDIITKGRAYSKDGKAFEGHHMKSVEAYPEFQADIGNIQFLTRTEHLQAHNGSFTNSTNGYFDPNTKTTKAFTTDNYEPCQIIELSEPNNKPEIEYLEEHVVDEFEEKSDNISENTDKFNSSSNPEEYSMPDQNVAEPASSGGFWNGVKHFFIRAWNNPIVREGVGLSLLFGAQATIDYFSGRSGRRNSNEYSLDDNIPDSGFSGESIPQPTVPSSPNRSSPDEHIVRGHSQRYGKNKEWKEKDPYPRGGKK